MAECPILEKCAFFNDRMGDMPATADMFKEKFCTGDFESCARYKVKQATGVSHETLMPNQADKVDGIIRELGPASE